MYLFRYLFLEFFSSPVFLHCCGGVVVCVFLYVCILLCSDRVLSGYTSFCVSFSCSLVLFSCNRVLLHFPFFGSVLCTWRLPWGHPAAEFRLRPEVLHSRTCNLVVWQTGRWKPVSKSADRSLLSACKRVQKSDRHEPLSMFSKHTRPSPAEGTSYKTLRYKRLSIRFKTVASPHVHALMVSKTNQFTSGGNLFCPATRTSPSSSCSDKPESASCSRDSTLHCYCARLGVLRAALLLRGKQFRYY